MQDGGMWYSYDGGM